ncbi:MAG TPA: hypothetical protein VNA16_02745 [Abditibacteriaceae bacterium]|nr:hypothetical protein [Abditibacteriaceae bacterium]
MKNLGLRHHVWSAAVLSALLMASTAGSVRAVTLEQKWQAGQQLDYNVLLNGTVNLLAPADAPFFLAGVPMQAKLDLKAQTTFDALAVADDGTGTVAVRVGGLKMTAEAFGGALVVENGRARIMMNGAPLDEGRSFNQDALQNPPFALQISRQGRVTNLVPIKKTAPANEAQPDKASGKGFDMGRFVVPLIMRALPTLWPARDLKIGDKWQGEVGWPVPQAADGKTTGGATAEGAAEPAPDAALPTVGKMDFTLAAEEEILGRKTQRIGVEGEVVLDAERIAALTKQADAKRGMPRLADAKQTVKGSIWFDAVAGQVVRADLKLQTTAHGQGKSTDAAGKSYMNFDGTLQMQLNKVSYAGMGAAPVAAAPVAR